MSNQEWSCRLEAAIFSQRSKKSCPSILVALDGLVQVPVQRIVCMQQRGYFSAVGATDRSICLCLVGPGLMQPNEMSSQTAAEDRGEPPGTTNGHQTSTTATTATRSCGSKAQSFIVDSLVCRSRLKPWSSSASRRAGREVDGGGMQR